jgi:glucose 1-dehydrogenase
MKALVVNPGKKDSLHFADVPDPKLLPDQVLVKTLRAGLCGTDSDINRGGYGEVPPGDDYLILGHENFGVVEEVGKNVSGFKREDFVVSTVRRPCGICYNCAHGENDMCSSGKYTERGIMRCHGFMTEFYVEEPQYLNVIAPEVEDIGVLLEPMSVVEKAIDHCFRIQKRMYWTPKLAVVVGAGAVGMLAAAVLRHRGLNTYVVGRDPANDIRSSIVGQLEAHYFSVANATLADLPGEAGEPIDIIIEATGSAKVAFDAMQLLAPDGILSLLSVTGGHATTEEPIDVINQDLVLRNNVVFGSVNANPRHFKMGASDMVEIEKKWPGVLRQLITGRVPWTDFKRWFKGEVKGIKTTLEISH